jgi:hypothetical protein
MGGLAPIISSSASGSVGAKRASAAGIGWGITETSLQSDKGLAKCPSLLQKANQCENFRKNLFIHFFS